MLSVFLYAFNAIAPILLMILLGYLLNRRQVFPDTFFGQLNFFAFHYCFPFLMFDNLYKMESIRHLDGRMALFLISCIVVITLLSVFLAGRVTAVRNRKGVIIQAGFRSNFALIGLPLAEGLAGTEGLTLTSAMQAPVVIYYNFFSVLFLAIYSEGTSFNVNKILRNLLRTPLLQGLLAGIAALLIREIIPVSADGTPIFVLKRDIPWIYQSVSYLGRVATPLALLSLGGRFQFSHVSGFRKELAASVLMRLLLAPAVGFTLAFAASHAGWIALTPAGISTMIACFGSPLSVSSAPMAAEMGGDAALAGQIVVWTSLFSMLTIFIMVVFFRAGGLL